jgi:hypothetical protein
MWIMIAQGQLGSFTVHAINQEEAPPPASDFAPAGHHSLL